MSKLLKVIALSVAMVSLPSCAEQETGAKSVATTADTQAVVQKLKDKLDMEVMSIEPAPIAGMYQVISDSGFLYVSADGAYVMSGTIFNLDNEMKNETEALVGQLRLNGVERFKDSVIEYKAEDEKYAITVFTDITCGYCRKLHSEVPELNAQGVTVRYLAYPRSGLRTEGHQNLVSVWCADDPQAALTKAKAGGSVARAQCENQVAEQYNFGRQVGVTGTPNIILENGEVIGGYVPASRLLDMIKSAS